MMKERNELSLLDVCSWESSSAEIEWEGWAFNILIHREQTALSDQIFNGK